METLKSKRSIVQTIVILVLGVLLFAWLGFFTISIFIEDHSEPKAVILLLTGIGSIAFSLYFLYYFLTNFPTVEISALGITLETPLNGAFVEYENIESIELMGKSPMSFGWITMPMESTCIVTKNSEKIIIWDDYYRNIGDLKLRLQKIKNSLGTGEFNPDEQSTSSRTPIDLRMENFVKISGNGLLNFNGLFFWGFTLFLLIFFGPKMLNKTQSVWPVASVIPMFYIAFGYQLNYYRVSENYFQIRNHLWLWKVKTFPLVNIKEIVLEEHHKLSNSVRVRTTDFKTTLHPGGSLRSKHWLELKDRLEKKGIVVRDELLH